MKAMIIGIIAAIAIGVGAAIVLDRTNISTAERFTAESVRL